MITTVLLDLDDTILDFHKAEKEALKKALQKVGVEPTEKLLARYSEINQAQWKKLELGELTQEEVKISRYRIFFEEYGITASPEETAKCYEQNLAYEHEKVDGALELLQKLHGKYRLYAASNGTYEVQSRRIEESGIKPYFEDFFISKKSGIINRTKNFSTIVLHIFLILSWKSVSLWATAYPQISLVEKCRTDYNLVSERQKYNRSWYDPSGLPHF